MPLENIGAAAARHATVAGEAVETSAHAQRAVACMLAGGAVD